MAEPSNNAGRPLPPPSPAQPQPPAQPPTPPAPRQEAKPKENIKETIESIIVAFILAFVFRAFVVEAFVIPSGSMAPTLLGAHMRFRCDDCGYRFDLNFPNRSSNEEEVAIPSTAGRSATFSVHCPNCGYKIPREEATDPAVRYGDRILVLKYLYLLQNPARWDVVVFKAPPSTDFATNYIKRLVGLPGETLMILDGDVYVCPNEKADPSKPIEQWPWRVQSKPRVAQDALWRVIYDNDYLPQNSDARIATDQEWHMPWQPTPGSAGWNDKPSRILHFDNPAGSGTLAFNKDANKGTYPFSDWLAYDETQVYSSAASADYNDEPYARGAIPRWYVSDLDLRFSYERHSGAGPLRASLTKLGHTFIAEFEPNVARLWHVLPDGTKKQIGKDVSLDFAGSSPLRVQFMNVDYHVTLRVNDRDLVRSTESDYAPDISFLLDAYRKNAAGARNPESIFIPKVSLSAERQVCDIAHLSLWRDIYYTPTIGDMRYLHASPDHLVTLHRKGDRDEHGNLLDNEYFVLGDNSSLSSDARAWTNDVDLRENEDLYAASGRVPGRFLLGKAFFVYWPAGYRPFSKTAPGVIPNFGEMRFIH